MYIYILVIIMFIFMYISSEIAVRSICRIDSKNNKFGVESIYLLGSFLILFLISALRGDFTSDYNSYIHLFKVYNSMSLNEILNIGLNQEIGYIILNKLISIFTKNSLYIIIVTTFITLYCFYNQIIKDSPYKWISILLFITIGPYYTSFNLIRQILAVGIVFMGSRYIYQKNIIKYVSVIILASLFHRSSLVMIPFYFILNSELSIKKLLYIIVSGIVFILFSDMIISIIQLVAYNSYEKGSYGMSGLKYTNAIMPVSILIFTLFHYKKLDAKDIKINVWINGIIFYTFFTILGLKVQMLQRIAEFFAPYALLMIPKIIYNIRDVKLKLIYIFLLVIICISYNYIVLSGTGYDPFYFIIDSNI